jgi:hypothetical protein
VSDAFPLELRNAIDCVSAHFQNQVVPELALQGVPTQVWHYTNPGGVCGILDSRRLWLSSSLTVGDPQEIHWGNAMVCAAAIRLEEHRSHPALDSLLRDHRASLFLRERELFIACFTEAADSAEQWRRDRCVDGAALVFDSVRLSQAARLPPVGATALLRVQYDDATVRRVAAQYFEDVLDAVETVSPPPAAEHLPKVAQWLLEAGFLAFFAKRRCWSWEREFRLIARTSLVDTLVVDKPRRVEVEIARPGALKEVVLGPAANAVLEGKVQALVAARWPQGAIAVRRSTAQLANGVSP